MLKSFYESRKKIYANQIFFLIKKYKINNSLYLYYAKLKHLS